MAKVLMILVAACLAAGQAAAADWPQWRGLNRDGRSAEEDWSSDWPAGGPKVLWQAEVGQGYSPVAVAAGRAYTMGWKGGQDTVWCLDAETGRTVWKYSYPCENGAHAGTRCTPTVDGGRVYTTSRTGLVVALDAATGKPAWSVDLFKSLGGTSPKWGYACSPLIVGDKLVLEAGVEGAAIVALAKADGKAAWKSGTEVCGYSSPVAYERGGHTFICAFTGTAVLGLRADDGAAVWRHPWEGMIYRNTIATPIVSGDLVFVSAAYGAPGTLVRFGDGKAEAVWSGPQMRSLFNTCALVGGFLYGIDGDRPDKGVMRCLEFATGKTKWDRERLGKGHVIAAGARLIIQEEEGDLAVAQASPEAYKELARAKVLDGECWTPPTISGGRIFCRNADGSVVALDVRKKM